MMRRFSDSLVVLGLLLAMSLPAMAQKGKGKVGGGGDDGGGDPPPPILYQALTFTMPYETSSIWTFDGNDLGQAVGGMYAEFATNKGATDQLAFFFDPSVNPTTAIDLNSIVEGIPDHLVIRRASSINESGDIAVYLDNPDDTVQHFYPGMIDMSDWPNLPPQLHLIDFDLVDDGSGDPVLVQNTLVQNTLSDYQPDYGIPVGLNDVGDMVIRYRRRGGTEYGYYLYNFGLSDASRFTPEPVDLGVRTTSTTFRSSFINNPTADREPQVIVMAGNTLGEYPRVMQLIFDNGLKPGPITEITPQASGDSLLESRFVNAINNRGTICGSGRVYTYKRGKITGQPSQVGLLWNGGSFTAQLPPEGFQDLNDSDDAINRFSLFHATAGNLDISQLLDPNDPITADSFSGFVGNSYLVSVAGRTDTGFPLVFGEADFDLNGTVTECGILYVPVPVPTEN